MRLPPGRGRSAVGTAQRGCPPAPGAKDHHAIRRVESGARVINQSVSANSSFSICATRSTRGDGHRRSRPTAIARRAGVCVSDFASRSAGVGAPIMRARRPAPADGALVKKPPRVFSGSLLHREDCVRLGEAPLPRPAPALAHGANRVVARERALTLVMTRMPRARVGIVLAEDGVGNAAKARSGGRGDFLQRLLAKGNPVLAVAVNEPRSRRPHGRTSRWRSS